MWAYRETFYALLALLYPSLVGPLHKVKNQKPNPIINNSHFTRSPSSLLSSSYSNFSSLLRRWALHYLHFRHWPQNRHPFYFVDSIWLLILNNNRFVMKNYVSFVDFWQICFTCLYIYFLPFLSFHDKWGYLLVNLKNQSKDENEVQFVFSFLLFFRIFRIKSEKSDPKSDWSETDPNFRIEWKVTIRIGSVRNSDQIWSDPIRSMHITSWL